MDINNATFASAPASGTQAQPPAPKNDKPAQEQQNSTVVKLSDQAQQMHRAESQNNVQQAVAAPNEAAKTAGVQFMQGDSKHGHINTYA